MYIYMYRYNPVDSRYEFSSSIDNKSCSYIILSWHYQITPHGHVLNITRSWHWWLSDTRILWKYVNISIIAFMIAFQKEILSIRHQKPMHGDADVASRWCRAGPLSIFFFKVGRSVIGWVNWLITWGFMDLWRPRVARRSNVGLVKFSFC